MNVNAIGSSVLRGTGETSAILRTTMASGSSGASGASALGGDRAQVSGPAALMNKLKELQQDDPAKLKTVLGEMSEAISKKAESSTDPREQRALRDMAEKFKAAGESGDLRGLQPPRGQGMKGGPPPGAPPGSGAKPVSAAVQVSATTDADELDPADQNEDGTVSQLEKVAYEAKQASKAEGAEAYAKQTTFGQREKVTQLFDSLSAVLDSAMAS